MMQRFVCLEWMFFMYLRSGRRQWSCMAFIAVDINVVHM